LKQSAIYTRRVQIPGAFMIFWAIGFLILLKLEYSNAAIINRELLDLYNIRFQHYHLLI